MKKVLCVLTLLSLVFLLSSCTGVSYIENKFYTDDVLEEGWVPDLPKPDGNMLYRTGTSAYCDKIYVSSEETPEEYFNRVLDYVQSIDAEMVGTVDWVKRTAGKLFLIDDSYVFRSTKEIAEPSASDYYNDDNSLEPYFSIIVSNNEIEQGEYHEPYQHPENKDIHWEGWYEYNFRGTLIRVCMEEKDTIEYDGGVFEYDYFIEVRVDEWIWMDYSYEPQK